MSDRARSSSRSPAYAPPTPDPLHEEPPADQYCDIVLNGGVASGVVYPWALLELAREYRFKNIGGNSVGAMAAAIAAAAEHGRCNGVANAFEPLRRMPGNLAALDGVDERKDEAAGRLLVRLWRRLRRAVRRWFGLPVEAGGTTKMLRLFQPSPSLQRLFALFVALVREDPAPEERALAGPKPGKRDLIAMVMWMYGLWWPLLFLGGLGGWAIAATLRAGVPGLPVFVLLCFVLAGAVLGTAVIGVWSFCRDLRRLADNGYGLCTGRGQEPGQEGLVEWLHRGIQLAAGRTRESPPLTFADLWATPRAGRPGPAPLSGGLQPDDPGINLQMFASNVTQGRPVRLPLADPVTRLFYKRDEWDAFFPRYVMDALDRASTPYAPASESDPDPARVDAPLYPDQMALIASLRELPSGGMPIVVAARLSLSFPILFSCVPVYAIDYEQRRIITETHLGPLPKKKRQRSLVKCLLSDGGLCTNFPIHLFDAAHPRWPTFGFLLDQRLKRHEEREVWLPKHNLEGRGDNWQRAVPGAEERDEPPRSLHARLMGLCVGLLLTTKDWNDRVTGRLPQVRNRVIRLALQTGEGQLNLGMPPETIMRMADRYGTAAGKELVKAFAPCRGAVKPAWREHLYVRSMVEMRALTRHLCGYSISVHARGATVPLPEVVDRAVGRRPLRQAAGKDDSSGGTIAVPERDAMHRAIEAIEALEATLAAGKDRAGPYRPVPEPELRMRPPI